MINLNVYRDVKSWKKPLHVSKTLLAKSYLKLLSGADVIGITGSVGKTLTQNAIHAVLSQKFRIISPDENLDPTFRIPQTILKTKPWHQKIILEYGVEHPGDMDHYLSLVQPKIAVITAIAPTHTKYFKDTQGVFEEKVKLVESLDKNAHAVLNADDVNVAKMAKQTKAKIWWFGKEAKNSIKISHFSQDLKGSKFRLHYQRQKASVNWKMVGEHQLTSAYAASVVGLIFGLTVKQIAKGLSNTKPPEHRLNLIVNKNVNILDDTYNASPKAASESLKTLIDLGKNKRKIAVLGQMKDLGNLSTSSHSLLGKQIANSNINRLITIGKTAKVIADSAKESGYKGDVNSVASTREAAEALMGKISSKSLVLVKGSRHAHLERIVNSLLGRSTTVKCYHCGVLK